MSQVEINMVIFTKAPGDNNFTIYQGNVLRINTETGRMTSHYDPTFDDMLGRPRQREDPVALARLASVLNGAANGNGRSRVQVSERFEASSGSSDEFDFDEEDSESDSDASEIEFNGPDKIVIRKGNQVKTYKKFKNSAPRRHPQFKDVTSDANDGDNSSFLSLTDHCINLILSHVETLDLFRLSTLCKRFYNLCFRKISSLQKLSSRDLQRQDPDDKEKFILPNQSNLVTLMSATEGELKELILETGIGFESYDCGIYFTKEISTAVSRNCCNLEFLAIEFNKLGGLIGLQSFAKHLPAKNKLKTLVLKGNDRKRDGKVLTERILCDLLKKTKNLERLHIESSDLIDGSSIVKHLKGNNLTSLSFCNCRNLDVSILNFVMKDHHTTIEHLHVYEHDPRTPWKSGYDLITNNPSLEITVKSPKLSKVQTFWAMRFDDSVPIGFDGNVNLSLLQLMPNLRELDLSFNCDLDGSPSLLRSVAAMCPLIEVLKLCGANIRYVKTLKPLENLFFLRKLSLFNVCCNYETPRWSIFDHDTFAREVLPLLKALTHLNFEDTDIRDAHIFAIIKNSPTLTFLETDLDKCDGSFIDKCCSIKRETPVTVATWISDKEMKGKSRSKLRDALKRCPKFLKVNTEYMALPEPKAWYHDY